MRGFKWLGTATNNKTGQYYVMYGRKGIVSLYETDKEFTEKKKTTRMRLIIAMRIQIWNVVSLPIRPLS